MEDVKSLNRKLNLVLILLAFVLFFAFTIARSKDIKILQTKVVNAQGQKADSNYDIWLRNGFKGTEYDFLLWQKGQSGSDGKNSVSQTTILKETLPINGKDGSSCSVSEDESYVYFKCTDGSNVTLEKPKDGEDGADSGRVQFQTNPKTCNKEYKYDNTKLWIVLVRDPDCVVKNG